MTWVGCPNAGAKNMQGLRYDARMCDTRNEDNVEGVLFMDRFKNGVSRNFHVRGQFLGIGEE